METTYFYDDSTCTIRTLEELKGETKETCSIIDWLEMEFSRKELANLVYAFTRGMMSTKELEADYENYIVNTIKDDYMACTLSDDVVSDVIDTMNNHEDEYLPI